MFKNATFWMTSRMVQGLRGSQKSFFWEIQAIHWIPLNPFCKMPAKPLCFCPNGWYLVGGLEHFCIFPYIGNVIIPTDFNSIIFQRERSTTTQVWIFHPDWIKHVAEITILLQGFACLLQGREPGHVEMWKILILFYTCIIMYYIWYHI